MTLRVRSLHPYIHDFRFLDSNYNLIKLLASAFATTGSAIRKAQLYASAIRSNRKSAAILSVVRCRTSGASVPDLINVVTKSTYYLLLAERVSVYLVDRIKGEVRNRRETGGVYNIIIALY